MSPPATSHSAECVPGGYGAVAHGGEVCCLACMDEVPKLQMEAPTEICPIIVEGEARFLPRGKAP